MTISSPSGNVCAAGIVRTELNILARSQPPAAATMLAQNL
jgi:hypothetical protein